MMGSIVLAVQPRWSPGRDGIGMTDEWREHPFIFEPPVPISILDGPVSVDGQDWYQVYVLPDSMRGPADFVAWVPVEQDGLPVVAVGPSRPCPDGKIGEIATLTPKSRADCFGDRTLRVAARSWFPGYWVAHRTDPAWLGTSEEELRSLALYEIGDAKLPRPPDPSAAWIDARVPPGVPMPPAGMTLLVEGQFDHPATSGCRRTFDRPGFPPTGGPPDEDEAASADWCRGQFVVASWDILLGPEDRPLVEGEVQLHHIEMTERSVCGGVGMPLMRFRMDLSEPDPVWLKAEGWSRRVIPVFGPGFRAVTAPELTVVGPRGDAIARDGTPLDPDAALGPYFVCPMGETVSITGP